MISENTKITLTLGQLRRLVAEGVAAGVAKDAALDAADAAIFGGAPVLKATEKGAEAYLKNDASVADEPKQSNFEPMDLTGVDGSEVHLGENGLPEYMSFKVANKELWVSFDAKGNPDWKGIMDANGNKLDAKALVAYTKFRGTPTNVLRKVQLIADTKFASCTGKTIGGWQMAIVNGGNPTELASQVTKTVSQTATGTVTNISNTASQQVATPSIASKAASTVAKVTGAQGSSGIQRIAPQSGVFGGDNLDTVDLDF